MDNKRFLKGEFLGSVSILALAVLIVTYVIIIDSEWTRFAFFKGLVTWAIVLVIKFLYPKLKPILA